MANVTSWPSNGTQNDPQVQMVAGNEDEENEMTPTLSRLMEKIRSRSSQAKIWPEIIKLTKNAFAENKRSGLIISDANEKVQIERALDTIQKSIKVKDHKSMIERLESITRSLNLKFMIGPMGKECFISSDMFYVEVVLDPPTGIVLDVKIAHQSDPTSCPELVNVLKDGNFVEFSNHLIGITSIYNLPADKKAKSKAYMALHSLETDLTILAQLQHLFNDPNNIIHKTPVGILEPRKGGISMKLTFFVSPYDLIDIKNKSCVPLSIDIVVQRKLGYSATICIESCPDKSHKLQTQSLITVSKSHEGKQLPQFAALSNLNSSSLPACFVLKLPKPVPISLEVLKKIAMVTSIDLLANETALQPLVHLIAMSVLDKNKMAASSNSGSGSSNSIPGSTNSNSIPGSSNSISGSSKCYYTKLPDQEHCYYMDTNTASNNCLTGLSLTSIPFTHPTHVPQILVFLRQQILFNVLIGSCIRKINPFSSSNDENRFTFEVTAQNMSSINVTFEHPVDDSLASLDIDTKEITSVKCRLFETSSFSNLCPDEFVTKVLQRSLSIPVTLRQVIVKSQEKAAILKEQQELKNKQAAQERLSSQGSGLSGLSAQSSATDDFTQFMANYRNSVSENTHAMVTNLVTNKNSNSTNHANKTASALLNQLQTQQQLLKAATTAAAEAAKSGQTQMAMSMAGEAKQRQAMIQGIQLQMQRLAAAAAASSSPASSSSSSGSKSQTSKQQQKQNAMLLNMLSDLPAANTSQQQQLVYNLYQQMQSQLPPVKKPRKRKVPEEGSKVNVSRKRKMSQEELLELLSDPSSSPSSSAGPSRPMSAQNSFERQRSFEELLLNQGHLLQRSLSASSSSATPDLIDGQSIKVSAKRGNRLRSNEELEQNSNLDIPEFPQLISRPSSVGPTTSSKNSKSRSNSNDGRRCSSAGIGEPNEQFVLEPALIHSLEKKDKVKRKRSESVDSLKSCDLNPSSNVSSSCLPGLMPPPLVSSSGEMTSSSSGMYKFTNDALRPITLNVKQSSLPSSTSGSNSSNSGFNNVRKSPTVSSTAKGIKSQEPKMKFLKGMLDMNGVDTSAGSIIAGSSLISRPIKSSGSGKAPPSNVKYIKSANSSSSSNSKNSSINPSSSSNKFKSPQHVSSTSSPNLSKSGQVVTLTSPPVSSSSVMTSPPITNDANVTSSKVQANVSSVVTASPGSQLKARKSFGSLSAVIDKLASKNTNVSQSGTSTNPDTEPDASSSSSSGLVTNPLDADSSCKVPKPGAKVSKSSSESSFKASISGTGKLTISKTKMAADGSKGPIAGSSLKIKAGTAAGGLKTTSGPRMKIGTGLGGKRPPTYKPGTQVSKSGSASGVSSSSSSSGSILSSPKSGSSSSLATTSPKARNANVSKVTSSGSKSSGNDKISSSSAILQEALPKLRLDQLPKIPKTPASVAAAAAAAAAAEAAKNAPPASISTPPVVTSPPINLPPPASSSSSTMGPPVGHSHVSIQRRLSREQIMLPPRIQNQNVRDVHQLDPRIVENSSNSDRFQSNCISSSHVNWSSTSLYSSSNNQVQEQPASSSSNIVMDSPFQAEGVLSSGPRPPATSSTSGQSPSCDSSETKVLRTNVLEPDEGPTSTPSSPVESGVVVDLLLAANPPPIIPIEAFDNESDRDDNASPSLMISDVIDSSDNVSNKSSPPPRTSSNISSSNCGDPVAPSSSQGIKNGQDDDSDDDEDGDGLVINDADIDQGDDPAPSCVNESNDAVSSSGPSSNKVLARQNSTEPNSSSPNSESPNVSTPGLAIGSSSSPSVTPSASTSSFIWPSSSSRRSSLDNNKEPGQSSNIVSESNQDEDVEVSKSESAEAECAPMREEKESSPKKFDDNN